MSTIYTRVSRVATWAGWCSPCERADRPLVLTRSGPGGLRAWLSGLGDDDRLLLLTCRVCGGWQLVPAREEDDPEIALEQDLQVEAVAEVREAVVALLPVPRTGDAPVEVVAVVPEPRRSVPRIVTVPESVPAPAFSPEVVAAAAQLLAAARAQTQRTAPRSAAPRPAPLDRSRRTRSGPTPRRTERPATARVVRTPSLVSPALPAALGLPAGTSQVVLAAAG